MAPVRVVGGRHFKASSAPYNNFAIRPIDKSNSCVKSGRIRAMSTGTMNRIDRLIVYRYGSRYSGLKECCGYSWLIHSPIRYLCPCISRLIGSAFMHRPPFPASHHILGDFKTIRYLCYSGYLLTFAKSILSVQQPE